MTIKQIAKGKGERAKQAKEMIGLNKETDKLFMPENEVHICSICDKAYNGYGNNARPISKGRCCDKCNSKVIMARISQLVKA